MAKARLSQEGVVFALALGLFVVFAATLNNLLPELTAEISGLVNQALPEPGGIGERHALGRDSKSFISPSFLTALSDKESYRNNELEQSEKLS